MKLIIQLGIIFSVLAFSHGSKPKAGKFYLTLPRDKEVIQNGLYQNSSIYMTLTHGKCNKNDKSNISSVCWTIQGMDCMAEISQEANFLTQQPWTNLFNHTGMYVSNCNMKDHGDDSIPVHCSDEVSQVTYYDESKWQFIDKDKRKKRDADPETPLSNPETASADPESQPSSSIKNLTETKAEVEPVKKPPSSVAGGKAPSAPIAGKSKSDKGLITRIPMEGFYHIVVGLKQKGIEVDVLLEIKNPFGGYLSAFDYPLLNFYMAMCILYACYAAAWLIMSACHYRDLLRVQFWIGGVILLGMIEKAVFYAEYKNVDDTGVSMTGAAKFAEVVSALKRALARMLVVIVSLGFGIVKPRLGPMLHRVIAVGVLYFSLAVVDAIVRFEPSKTQTTASLYTFIPLAIVDSIICWWVLISLMTTMKTLRLRRNVVKLSLYRHFFNTILVCVLMSVVLVFWSYRSHQEMCVGNWNELWIETALWHVLFSVILLVIMVLWRPNANNQIYAYSPMIDGNDSDASDDVEEPMLGSGATETMKLRSVNAKEGGAAKTGGDATQTEDDLKWIEENIPQSMADTAMPILIDSEDDERETKLEMSKIE